MKLLVVYTKSIATSFALIILINYSYPATLVLCPIGVPPDIDEGPFISPQPSVPPGDIEVQIGSDAYVVDGFDVTIVCNILTGTHPITIIWLHNGVADPTRGNVSTITVTYYNDGDVYTCRAENNIGFDNKRTTINVFGK